MKKNVSFYHKMLNIEMDFADLMRFFVILHTYL